MKNNEKIDKQMKRAKELADIYNSEEAPIEVYQELHWLLWDWLADNPDKEKDVWPGWKHCKDKKDFCFACMYAHKLYINFRIYGFEMCRFCPVRSYCHCTSTDYMDQWYIAKRDKDQIKCQELAIKIRDCWPIEEETL